VYEAPHPDSGKANIFQAKAGSQMILKNNFFVFIKRHFHYSELRFGYSQGRLNLGGMTHLAS